MSDLLPADKQRKERKAFDQSGRDNHGGLNVARNLRLPGHAFDGRSRKTADTIPCANDHQTAPKRGGEINQCPRFSGARPPPPPPPPPPSCAIAGTTATSMITDISITTLASFATVFLLWFKLCFKDN